MRKRCDLARKALWAGCGWEVDLRWMIVDVRPRSPGTGLARAAARAYLLGFPVLTARPASRLASLVRPLVAAALASVVLGGCSFFRLATGIGLQRPSLTFESWSPEQLDAEGVTIALHYRLDNPNDFALDLRRLDYRLDVEGKQVAEGQLPGGVTLRAQGATPLAFPVRLRWRDVPGVVELLLTRSDVAYRVSGTAGVGSELGTVALPFEHRDRVALPRLPLIRTDPEAPFDGRGGGADAR